MEYIRTRIKFCGITRPQDAVHAAGLGADAIGLVFSESSPRHVDIQTANYILGELPAFVSVVGLFVNAPSDTVKRITDQVALDVLQFHGDETADYCTAFSRPFIKALKVKNGEGLQGDIQAYTAASAILLDAWHEDLAGGTGESFEWSLIPQAVSLPLLLAGGLDAGNVGEAIRSVRPYAVDVSSGIESAPGIKSAEKMKAFVNAVNNV